MFQKTNAARDVLYSLARFCSLKPEQLSSLFKQEAVYPRRKDWFSFLERFLLVLSAVLVASGVLFFFAYNWADMHKFVKLGLLQAVIVLLIALNLFSGFDKRVKEILLTGSAVMLGVLFAVYGQIYQTGANAYDFFQGWTMAVLLWAVAGRTNQLWFLFLLLINLTLHFYAEQVARYTWPSYLLPLLLFLINSTAVIIWEILWTKGKIGAAKRWFPTLVGLAAVTIHTLAVCEAVFREFRDDKGINLLLTALLYSLGFWYGYRIQLMFYPAALGLSLIVIGTCLLLRLLDHSAFEAILLLSSMFVIGTTTALAYYLRHLNRHWYGKH